MTDTVTIFEVSSDDTATTDRVDKLIEYGALPSLRVYVLLEQSKVGAAFYQRPPVGVWVASAHTTSARVLPGLDITVPLQDVYQGLTFPA